MKPHQQASPKRLAISVVYGVLLAASVAACSAQPAPPAWPAECVGRLALHLPGQVDVAAMTAEQFMQDSGARAYQFNDGENAFYSHFQYGGNVAISGPITPSQRSALLGKQREKFADVKKLVASGEMTGSDFKPLALSKLDATDAALGWKLINASEVTYIAFPSVAGHEVSWKLSGTGEQNKVFATYLAKFRGGVRPRQTLSIPPERGVCMPHLFIRDEGDDTTARLVAATYRSREHPDVTIMLKDATAASTAPSAAKAESSAIAESNFFWTQDYQQARSVSSLLHGSHNKVKLAGRSAVETMFRIERKDDGGEDFGYLVVARGDAKAAVDTPDIMLYVIRNAGNAKKKGIAPLSKDAFFAMAKSIAASVTHRDMQ